MKDVVFIWENFGPIHADRCDAVAQTLPKDTKVIGIELFGNSSTYSWISEARDSFNKVTVFPGEVVEERGVISRYIKTLLTCLKYFNSTFFLCHYEHPATLLLAITLRALGRTVIVMNDSKFDDCPRNIFKELLKFCFYLPYSGAIGSGERSTDYLRFLGINKRKIKSNYNSMSTERIKGLAQKAPRDISFLDRPIVVVARLVKKKNLFTVLDSFAHYRNKFSGKRKLIILGDGPLENDLRAYALKLGVSENVEFKGFLQIDEVARILVSALCLVLMSTEEQFGNVIIEANALSIPAIVSTQVGARDHLVKSGVNGFIVEPNNPQGCAFFMHTLDSNESLWRTMSSSCKDFLPLCDCSCFASAVNTFVSC